ncbi:DUF2513 domain-containing protein [Pseudomonas sp. G2-4]|uniref:DUF2513 domain-containing protein n=1 Tax=Pseudomonas sp. G2-4 TaxID=1506334 RepID=UPI0024B92F71|nr:DUF2513 domain-containing protein [Pseudomonas sp. G2-4]WHS63120.1 DUF2513 domain-containing protein [Pseudomonas sp. G2-4]
MKRDQKYVKHLLDLVQAEASLDGITKERLVQRFVDTDGGHGVTQQEARYTLSLAIDAGFLKAVKATNMLELVVQLTWAGHDYIDEANAKIKGQS